VGGEILLGIIWILESKSWVFFEGGGKQNLQSYSVRGEYVIERNAPTLLGAVVIHHHSQLHTQSRSYYFGLRSESFLPAEEPQLGGINDVRILAVCAQLSF
jgi:hypothetical protein